MIKVAVAGARGRMGSLVIKNVLEDADLELVAAFDFRGVGEPVAAEGVVIKHPSEMDAELKAKKPDVLVDFTNAEAAVENVKIAARNGVRLVVGTTGFSEGQMREMREAIDGNVPAVISPNFSIGVNVFWRLLAHAAEYLRDYDVEIVEAHHSAKKDAPSGTALKAARIIAERKGLSEENFVFGRRGLSPRSHAEIGIHAVRAGDIVGEHTAIFARRGERIELTHRAHSREAFAQGAILAVKWVFEVQESGVYSMEDVLWG